ncbi:MAG: [FeFe] hydrogenase H-cluster maturation GTPase HydF [Planctomycetia bacterium]|nr:[FeFe] hydrogenase H-cluster maturation GTPase HydF [Planctomycetia bacterium]
MPPTPKGLRLHIGIFGRRNVGKSSLLNAITAQNVSIVSDVAGTTTDPVEKPMELLPLGPVLFIDTAGVDDVGTLGEERIRRTRQVFDRTELAILVLAEEGWGDFEEELYQECQKRKLPVLVVWNKTDLFCPDFGMVEKLRSEYRLTVLCTSLPSEKGCRELKEAILQTIPEEWFSSRTLVADLLPPAATVILVIPIDKEAPQGRLILPQVQTLRELLDYGMTTVVVRPTELADTLRRLKNPPALVITDSQVFREVDTLVPSEIPLTGFSVLFARWKGEWQTFLEGTKSVENLRPGDHVLVTESCTHHPIGEDIGRVKIPRWLQNYVGGKLHFTHVQGHDFPNDLSPYQLVIQCGGCMVNRRAILSKIMRCREQHVPITNYGLIIAYSLGIFDRATAFLR